MKYIKNVTRKKPSVINSSDKLLYKQLIPVARELRKNPTDAEKLLWDRLKNTQLGIKFRRQHIINKFIVDFCTIRSAIIIELDGRIHDFRNFADSERTTILENKGYKIIRFKNAEVLYDIDYVVKQINTFIKMAPGP